MKQNELRWSYDPRTKELDVWDSEGGRIDHHRRHGQEGYENCSQGRIYPDRSQIIYGNRPFIVNGKLMRTNYGESEPDPDLTALLEEAKLSVEAWMNDNNLPVGHWYVNY